MDIKNLTGQSQTHLVPLNSKEGSPLVNSLMKDDYLNLYKRCKQDNIELKIVSSYRSFDRQLRIWNAKANGERDIYDKNDQIIDISNFSDIEKVHAIMRWSALPGASRHHWGTDIDIIDENARPLDYQIQLIPSEYLEGGLFSKVSSLLSKLIDSDDCFNFFRPYETERNGVSQELWHLSYSPIANKYKQAFTYDFFKNFLDQQDKSKYALLDSVKENSKELFEKYIINTD